MRLKTTYKIYLFTLIAAVLFVSCNGNGSNPDENGEHQLTIFFTNDIHGHLDNFSKVKKIVDEERELTNVLLLNAGDIFSGNPIVDQHEEKGFPIIDLMNKVGYDASVLGNHEFDYGIEILNNRMNQATFEWVCANVDTESTVLQQPDPYKTLDLGGFTVTILGLVETDGKPDDIIPLTHPWRVVDLTFRHHQDVIPEYEKLKEQEGSDILIALTHLGSFRDVAIANEFPFFDIVIGGHTNNLNDGEVNGIPVVMAGSRLSHLGKMELTIQNKQIVSSTISLIDLNDYEDFDAEMAEIINVYNDNPQLAEVVGYANSHHERDEIGCFYTTALKEYMNVDVSFQNGGGIRANIDEGDITRHEIFNMDPFNNGSVAFTMTAGEIEDFLIQTGAGLHVSGITLERSGNEINIYDEDGNLIDDNVSLTVGINDYIAAVYDSYFPYEDADIRELTAAESIIQYLKTINSTMDQEGCNRFFSY